MKSLGQLLTGLVFLAVFVAACFGVWSAANPDGAKAARDRAIQTGQRLKELGDRPPSSLSDGERQEVYLLSYGQNFGK